MTFDWDERYRNWCEGKRHRDEEFERQSLRLPGSRSSLRKLTKLGADRGRILEGLSLAVIDITEIRKVMKHEKRNLENIARQLTTVANHAQRISLDPFCHCGIWLAVLALNDGRRVKSAKELSPTYIFELMRGYSKNCWDRAKGFGWLIKYHRSMPPIMIDSLLTEVWISTKHCHDKEVACLLSNAFEAVGKERRFTDQQIKKHRQRRVTPRLNARKAKISPNVGS